MPLADKNLAEASHGGKGIGGLALHLRGSKSALEVSTVRAGFFPPTIQKLKRSGWGFLSWLCSTWVLYYFVLQEKLYRVVV